MESKELKAKLLKEARETYEGKYLKYGGVACMYIEKVRRVRIDSNGKIDKIEYSGIEVNIPYIGPGEITRHPCLILRSFDEHLKFISHFTFITMYNKTLKSMDVFTF